MPLQRIDPTLSAVPYIEEYAGVWAIREREAHALVRAAERMNLSLHLQQVNIGEAGQDRHDKLEQRRRGDGFLLSPEGVAIVELSGSLTKQSSSFSGGTSTVEARRQIRAAARSGDVSSIVLLIDSPGGAAKGTADLADEVRRARESSGKRVVAFVEDLAASAAYFAASQADEIVANQPEAIVGSLGTLLVVYDLSQQAADEGVKVHVISTGKFKGMGVPGSEITDEHLAELKREVDFIDQSFRRAVQRGRNLSAKQIEELFTGQVWAASEAKELGLVDSIETFDALLARLENPAPQSRTRRSQTTTNHEHETAMSEKTAPAAEPLQQQKAATIKEIKQHCKGADADFILEMKEAEATLTQCMSAWMERQDAKLAKAEEDKKAAVEAAKKQEETAAQRAQRRGLGTTSLSDDGEEAGHTARAHNGDAPSEMVARRNQIMREQKCGPGEAMKILRQEDPELLEQAVGQYDQQYGPLYRKDRHSR